MRRTELEMRPSETVECQPLSENGENNGRKLDKGFKIDAEGNVIVIEGFSDLEIRRNFVTKVYSIVTFQLLLTLAIVLPTYLIESVRHHLVNHVLFYSLIPLLPIIVLVCLLKFRYNRTHPHNLIILFVITMLASVSIAAVVAHYKGESVLIALSITGVTFICVTFISAIIKVDVTAFLHIMFMLLFVLMISLISAVIAAIYSLIKLTMLLYGAIGCILSVLFIAMDTKMLVDGKREYQLTPEDYVMGALIIYTDFIRLFLWILKLVGKKRDKN